jgi:chromosome segregation ATPase
MKARILILGAAVSLFLAPPLAAQGRGGGGGRTSSGQQRSQPSASQRGGQTGQSQQGTRGQSGQRVHINDQQRGQYETSTRAADRTQDRVHQMAQSVGNAGTGNAEMRQQHDQLRNDVRTMQEEHDRFMKSLNDDQRAAIQERVRSIEESRDRVNNQMRQLGEELAKPEADRNRIQEHVAEMDKAMQEWRKQYGNMGTDMGVQP